MVSTARARVRESAGNLPVDVTSFVGRRREITLTKRLLAESRLVTLTGQGGVGKTRLALRVGTNMRRLFRDKVWFVSLEDLRDPELLADVVIDQLSLGGPGPGDDVETVVERLKHREMLLILDNCEHVVEAASTLVETILRWCPGVRVLATSRQSLGVAGESTVVVPPLQVPDIEHLPPLEAYEQYSSVRLFVERAKAAVPEFELDEDNGPAVMRLCHELDGNPLAIELAAVRLRSMSPRQIEERLSERYDMLASGRRNAPARQQSLRALIDWSYELCSEQDKTAWARVSVFSGSFDLAAAEFVIADGLSRTDVLTTMHSLVDKSVLVREEEDGEVRFRLLHALREYGQEKLRNSTEENRVRARHLEWYEDLVNRFSREWLGPAQVPWVKRLSVEHGNIRVALHSALELRPADALNLAARLTTYWGLRGLTSEARYWFDRMPRYEDVEEFPRVLWSHAWFALIQGDQELTDRLLADAKTIIERRRDDTGMAYVLQVMGMAAYFRGELLRAAELLENALSRFQSAGERSGELFALFGLGMVRGRTEDYDTGLDILARCIHLSGELGELFWRSYALWASAHLEVSRGMPDRAEEIAKDALRLQRRLGSKLAAASTVATLAWIADQQGRHERAARLFGAASSMWDRLSVGQVFSAVFNVTHTEHEDRTRRMLGEHVYQNYFDEGYALSPSAAKDLALETKRAARAASRDNVHQMPLTRREREIAELVSQGRTNKEIAESLVIAQRTVEGHVQHILTKLDFSSRAQIAGWVAGQQNQRSSR